MSKINATVEDMNMVLDKSNLPIVYADHEKDIFKIICTPEQKGLIEVLFSDVLDDDIVQFVIIKSAEQPQKCPICGGETVTMIGEYNVFPSGQRGYYVACKECGMRTGYHRTEEKAIRSWNRHVKKALDLINNKNKD